MHCSLPSGRAMHFLYMESPPQSPQVGEADLETLLFSPFGELEGAKRRQDLEGFSSLPEKKIFQTGENGNMEEN